MKNIRAGTSKCSGYIGICEQVLEVLNLEVTGGVFYVCKTDGHLSGKKKSQNKTKTNNQKNPTISIVLMALTKYFIVFKYQQMTSHH